jgi:hypothetical protein
MNYPPICLPRVGIHADVSDVEFTFNAKFRGDYVESVDVSYTKDTKGKLFQAMFVHFKQDLPENVWTKTFFDRLEKDQMINLIVYNGNIWKVYHNTPENIKFLRVSEVKPGECPC